MAERRVLPTMRAIIRPATTFANFNGPMFEVMGDAAADAVLQFAMTTSAVKGTSKAADAAVGSCPSESLKYKGSRLQK